MSLLNSLNTPNALSPSLFSDVVAVILEKTGFDLSDLDQAEQVVATLKSILDGSVEHDLIEAIKSKNIALEDVAELLNTLSRFGLDLGESVSKWFKPVAQFAQAQSWPLIDVPQKEKSANLGLLKFTGSMSLDASCSLQYQGHVAALQDKLAVANNLMVYSLAAEATLDTDIGLSLKKGAFGLSLGAALSADADNNLTIYCHTDPDTPLLKALYLQLSDLDDIPSLRAFISGSVKALQYQFEGQLRLSSQVDLGYSWTLNQTAKNAFNKYSAGAKIGVGHQAQWDLAGALEVLAYIREQQLFVEIKRQKTQGTQSELSVGATLQMPGAKEYAQTYLDQLSQYDNELNAFLNEFAEPEQKLRELLNQELEKLPSWQQDLLQVASGQQNADALKSSLADKLTEELEGYFQTFEDWLDDEEKISEITTRLAAAIGQQGAEDAADYLSNLVAETAKRWQQKYTDKAKSMLSNTNALKPLEKFGLDVDNYLNKADKKVEDILSSLQKLRTNYSQKLQLLQDFINTGMVEEIGIGFKRARSKQSQENVEFKVSFNLHQNASDLEKVANLFARCVTADCTEVMRLARTGEGAHLFKLHDCTVNSMLNDTLTTSLSVNLFGLKVTSQSILDEKAILEYDGQGQISVFEGVSSYKKYKQSGNESNVVKVNNWANLLADHESKFSVSSIYKDEDLSTSELYGYMRIFQKTGLIAPGSASVFEQLLAQKKLINSDKDQQVTINCTLPISSADLLANALADDDEVKHDEVREIAIREQCKSYIAYLNLENSSNVRLCLNLLQVVDRNNAIYKNALDLLELRKGKARSKLTKAAQKLYRGTSRDVARNMARKALRFANQMEENAEAVLDFVATLQSIKSMQIPEIQAPEDAAKTKSALNSKLKQLNQALQHWIKPPTSLFQINMERVNPTTIGFLATLQAVCNLEDGVITPVIYYTENGRIKPLILV